MRKGIADLYARAQVSDASNKRYIEALASFNTSKTIAELVSPICKANKLNNKRVRPIRPWEKRDKLLLQTANNGDYVLTGFRNRDLFAIFYPPVKNKIPTRKYHRLAGIITLAGFTWCCQPNIPSGAPMPPRFGLEPVINSPFKVGLS